MAGAAKRIEREQVFYEANAWMGAQLAMVGFHNPKKFPQFNKVRSRSRPKKRQSSEEQMAIAKMLNAAFGGKVVKT